MDELPTSLEGMTMEGKHNETVVVISPSSKTNNNEIGSSLEHKEIENEQNIAQLQPTCIKAAMVGHLLPRMLRNSPERTNPRYVAKPPQLPQARSRSVERLSTERPSKRLQGMTPTYVYKYKLLHGNNGRVLLGALRKRPWWHATSKVDAATTDYDQNDELPSFIWEMYRNPKRYKDASYADVMLNHLEHNNGLVTKKGLYLTLKAYCDDNKDYNLLDVVPRTYYLPSGQVDLHNGDMKDFLEFNRQALAEQATASSSRTNTKVSVVTQSIVVPDPTPPSSSSVVDSTLLPSSESKDVTNAEINLLSTEPAAEENKDNVSASSLAGSEKSENKSSIVNSDTDDNPETNTTAAAKTTSSSSSSSTVVVGKKQEELLGYANNVLDDWSASKDATNGLVWILKPASRTNRGFGIKVVRGVQGVMEVINRPASSTNRKSDKPNGIKGKREAPETEVVISQSEKLAQQAGQISRKEGWIVQLYMDRPMLISGRKFDIRCYVLVTNFPKQGLKAYFFREAYVRTSSKKYSLTSLADREAHLTNDAVQKNSKCYGKFEEGNKMSFEQWQETILRDYPHAPPGIIDDIVEKKFRKEFRRLAAVSVAAAAEEMKQTSINKSFELLGYDFMIDADFKSYLIEINSNPCLEFVCPLLTGIISSLIENVVRVALDTQCPPAPKGVRTKNCEDIVKEIEESPIQFDQIYPFP